MEKSPKALEAESQPQTSTVVTIQPRLRHRIIHWIWIAVCLIGFLYQSYMVSMMFFGDQLDMTAVVERPNLIYPPSFSFCFPIADVIKCDKLPDDIRQACQLSNCTVSKRDLHAKCGHALKNMSHEEVKTMTMKFTDLVEKVWYTHPSNLIETEFSPSKKNLEKFDVENVIDFFMHGRKSKCFHVKLFHTCRVNAFYRMELNNFFNAFFRIKFKPNFGLESGDVSKIWLFIHPKEIKPHNDVQRIILEKDTTYRLGYSGTHTVYHVGRFRPRCRNYAAPGVESRDHQVAKCLQYQHHDKDLSNITREESIRMFQVCQKEFPLPDCDMVSYTPRMLKNDKNDCGQVDISFMLEDSIKMFKYEPKVCIGEYLVYMSSIFGIWFGFSFLGAFRQVSFVISNKKWN